MRYVVGGLGQFLFKIAFDYVRHGYVYYRAGVIPIGKDPVGVDLKLRERYGVIDCRTTRARRRQQGLANVVYLRWENRFVLLATDGNHEFFTLEQPTDIRVRPLYMDGYVIGVWGYQTNIRIAPRRYCLIRKQVQAIALHNHAKVLDYFSRISPFGFRGVRWQLQKLMREVNQRRRAGGLLSIKFEYGVRLLPRHRYPTHVG